MQNSDSAIRISTCQLLTTPPADGAWNMAVDEALLGFVAQTEQPVLRFYQWQSPTLSLGYFQKSTDRVQHPLSQTAPFVRRLSGGGAILHDRELTYSLTLPTSHFLSQDTQALYDTVHQAIIETLNRFLVASQAAYQAVSCRQTDGILADQQPFLCFQRRFVGDILLLDKTVDPADRRSHRMASKIVGSAQRRRQGTILQHGSILLEQSPMSPELNGISEIADLKISTTDLLAALLDSLTIHFSCRFENNESLVEAVAPQIQNLKQKKYLDPGWNERR